MSSITKAERDTPEFLRFRAECRRQLRRLNLQDWDVTIRHALLEGEDSDSYADVDSSFSGKVALITLNSKYIPDDPERIAKHEVSHLFLNRLGHLAELRYLRQEELDETMESLCIVLEKVL